jgi:isoleucyl-tRNA synthetase
VTSVEKSLNEFAIADACAAASDFIDVLTNWYIRNTRDRFWKEDAAAFNTLYTALEVFARTVAPLMPMEAETIWRGLTGGESVHLADWPYLASEKTGEATDLGRVVVDDPELVASMEKVREVVSATLSLRKVQQIRVRQPLSKLTVVVEDVEAVRAYSELLTNELNVKAIEFSTLEDARKHGLELVSELRVNARAAGPRLGKNVQFAIKASKSGAWKQDAATGAVTVSTPAGDLALEPGEYEVHNSVRESDASEAANTASTALPTGGFVLLDTELTPDLEAEGWARDAIRTVQDARKDAGLDITDRIALSLVVPTSDELGTRAAEQFRDLISSETLATSLEISTAAGASELAVSLHKA